MRPGLQISTNQVFWENIIINNIYFNRQCKKVQFEKPSLMEIEISIHKTLTINLLKGIAKRTSLWSDRLNPIPHELWKDVAQNPLEQEWGNFPFAN